MHRNQHDANPIAEEDRPSRRTILRGVAAAGALGASTPMLSACGSDSPSATPDGGGKSPNTPNTPKAGNTGSPSGGSPTAGSGGGGTLGAAAKVPVGGGAVFEKEKVVVTQPEKGHFHAFSAICTHQGCTVASVEDGTINCPCHGSKFSFEDGSVVSGPAEAPLAEKKVTVADGQISLA